MNKWLNERSNATTSRVYKNRAALRRVMLYCIGIVSLKATNKSDASFHNTKQRD